MLEGFDVRFKNLEFCQILIFQTGDNRTASDMLSSYIKSAYVNSTEESISITPVTPPTTERAVNLTNEIIKNYVYSKEYQDFSNGKKAAGSIDPLSQVG